MTDYLPITIDIIINAHVEKVWSALTEPELIQQWILEEPIEIMTDWKVGGPIIIKGHIHGVYFENTGKVLQFKANEALSYEHLSSLSKLPDELASYTIIKFKLQPVASQTLLKITLSNFPTESVYKHLKFYWNTTAGIVKKFIEVK